MRRTTLALTAAALAAAAGPAAAAIDNQDRARLSATAAAGRLTVAEKQLARAALLIRRSPDAAVVPVRRARASLRTFMAQAEAVDRSASAALAGSNLAVLQRSALTSTRNAVRVRLITVRSLLVTLRTPQYSSGPLTPARVRAAFLGVRLVRRSWRGVRSWLAQSVRVVPLGSFALAVPATPFAFLPSALPRGRGVVRLGDQGGVDRMDLLVQGMPAGRRLTIWLTQNPAPPFGAAQYVADVTPGPAGSGQVTVAGRLRDAVALNGTGRIALDNLVLWLADPAEDNGLFAGVNRVDPDADGDPGPTTPFDRDGRAGAAVLVAAGPAVLRSGR